MGSENKEKPPMHICGFITEKDMDKAAQYAAACDDKDCKGGPYLLCLWCGKGAGKSRKRGKR